MRIKIPPKSTETKFGWRSLARLRNLLIAVKCVGAKQRPMVSATFGEAET